MSILVSAFVDNGKIDLQVVKESAIDLVPGLSLGFEKLEASAPSLLRLAVAVSFEGEDSSLEFSCLSASDEYPVLAEKLEALPYVYDIRFGSRKSELRAAFAICAALVKHFGARIYDHISYKFWNFDELMVLASGNDHAPEFYRSEFRKEVKTYQLQANEDGKYSICQRCQWTFPAERSEALCLECAARCPVCDSRSRMCARAGVFQIRSNRDYFSWIKKQHQAVGQEFEWFEYVN